MRSAKLMFLMAAGVTLVAPISTSSAAVAPGWVRWSEGDGQSYCVDGADYYRHYPSQHLAIRGGAAGQLYVMGCDESNDPEENSHIYQYSAAAGNFRPLPGWAEWMSVSPTSGTPWVVNVQGHIYGWNGSWWPQKSDLPGSRAAHSIAVVNDQTAYVLDNTTNNPSCPGGSCIWSTSNGGSTWTQFFTDYDFQGATQLAVDPVTGVLWVVANDGHVLYVGSDPYYGTYWNDVGTTGLPPNGANNLAVYNSEPWIIADVNSEAGGPVYRLAQGATSWLREGPFLNNATDIARDASNGRTWIVTYNGPAPGDGGNKNIYFWGF